MLISLDVLKAHKDSFYVDDVGGGNDDDDDDDDDGNGDDDDSGDSDGVLIQVFHTIITSSIQLSTQYQR